MLIRTDAAKARDLLRDFAWFYRRTLEDNEGLVTLSQELEYARLYLGFEGARFGDRLAVVEDVDERALDVRVPAFILQPLVENCVSHGISAEGPLKIAITVSVHPPDTVSVVIADDGVGIRPEDLPRVLEAGFGKGLGIALKNVDDRVRGHFGPGSGLAVASEHGEGTTVTMTLVVPRESSED
jgi:two-component system sensor histidine kinase LytS